MDTNDDSQPPPTPPKDPRAMLKKRRQTAIYPSSNSTSKPFSRSAAKRDSVMALGSIEHLQHYFTKAGLAAKQKPQSNSLLLPAIGSLASMHSIAEGDGEPHSLVLPPSPLPNAPSRPAFPTVDRTYVTDPEVLKPGVINDLSDVEAIWAISQNTPSNENENDTGIQDRPLLSPHPNSIEDGVDILQLLQVTTRAIRSVRNYVVSLPDESAIPSALTTKSTFRPSTMKPQPPPKTPKAGLRHITGAVGLTPMHTGAAGASLVPPGTVPPVPALPSTPTASSTASFTEPGSWETSLSQIRKWALEVLHVLHALEVRARLPLSDEAYDMQSEASESHSHSDLGVPSDHGGAGGSILRGEERLSSASPQPMPPGSSASGGGSDSTSDPDQDSNVSFSFSVMTVSLPDNSRRHIRVWSGSDDELLLDSDDGANNSEPGKEKWDERIVLGSGWLYRSDLKLEELEEERDVIKRYLDVVDGTLFRGTAVGGGARGWTKEKGKGNLRKTSGGGKMSPELLRSQSPLGSALTGLGSLRLGSSLHNPKSLQPQPLSLATLGLGNVNEEDESLETAHPIAEEPEEIEVPDDELPEWARRKSTLFGSEDSEGEGVDVLSRAHALLVHLLPSNLLHVLPLPLDADEAEETTLSPLTPTTALPSTKRKSKSRIPRTQFLSSLSSGQLLCVAYNAGVRKSRKQWGFINPESVHDVVGMEAQATVAATTGAGGGGGGWTFRRIDNLRLFAAALKLRYMIPISTPAEKEKAKAKSKAQGGDSGDNKGAPIGLVFDAKVVARRDAGWEDMLEGAVLAWVEEVVKEKRVRED